MKRALMLSALFLLTATVTKAAPKAADANALWSQAQGEGAAVKTQVQAFKAEQAKRAADAKNAPAKPVSPVETYLPIDSKELSKRIAGAGKGLRTEEFPLDPKIARLSAYAEKILFKPTGLTSEGYSWRRNSWGVCRAWLTCTAGRQISCWAEGYNCDA